MVQGGRTTSVGIIWPPQRALYGVRTLTLKNDRTFMFTLDFSARAGAILGLALATASAQTPFISTGRGFIVARLVG